MMISIRAVRHSPRTAGWRCEDCREGLYGPHLYLFGASDRHEKPYAIRIHGDCGDYPPVGETPAETQRLREAVNQVREWKAQVEGRWP